MTIANATASSASDMSPLVETAIEILADLVSFDTVSSKSNVDAIAFIEAYFKRLGATTVRIPAKGQEKENLWVTIGPGRQGGLVLSGHIDVVPVDGQEWTRPPFKLTREGERLYGRGTTDMKGFLACVMAVCGHIHAAQLSVPVHVAVTFDEEVGHIGAFELAAFLKGQGIEPAAFIVGEPTRHLVVDRHKGSVGFTTEIVGREAHSSQVHLGINAIDIAAEVVSLLNELHIVQRDVLADDAYPYPYPSINVGTIRGGHVRNIVAPGCTLEWEMRPILPKQLSAMRREFDERVAKIISRRSKKGMDAPEIRTRCLWDAPPLLSDPASQATSIALQATGHNQTSGVSYGTEAGVYQQAGFPTVVCGPGDIAQAHTADEWISVKELETCLLFLERLIAKAGNPLFDVNGG
ncbi:acetylornithine deacetylase [Rhizobium azooxidifex]|uniref:Acetylornithine deacetylase n=1 Tax=Mycoplana azooxidifex TaxID=1636188 RepID=A0A7W6DHF9_9HYPH|nr:acetylornithine deacetylase [Mycoplana azooxidifex]MBB3979888.1 acetylornithine deacetylase [Mycoplana azooxidifex]